MGISYNGTVINDSPTIALKAGEKLTGGPFTALAIKNGALVTADGSLTPFGITTAETDDEVAAGDDVTVQIKDIGMWEAATTFQAGSPLTSNANGKATTATTGKFILAYALEDATTAGQFTRVQITKSGYAPA